MLAVMVGLCQYAAEGEPRLHTICICTRIERGGVSLARHTDTSNGRCCVIYDAVAVGVSSGCVSLDPQNLLLKNGHTAVKPDRAAPPLTTSFIHIG